MDATCTIQDSIHVFSLVHKYVSRILGTYHNVQTQLDTLVKETHKAIIDTRVAFEKTDKDNIKFWKG